MLTNREVILAKIESVYNTDPTPTGASDAVLVESTSWSHEGARMIDRPLIKSTLGRPKQLFGGTLKQITFTCEMKGSGAAGTAPEIGPLLRACGLGETIVASTSVTYAPVSTGFESVTIYYYQDGILHKLTGCRGNVTFDLTAGGVAKATFTMTGHEASPTDTTIATPTYDSTVPVPLLGLSSLAVQSYSAIIQQLAIDLANEISTPESMAATDGYGEIRITDRDVKGTLNPEMTLVATHDWVGKWKTAATGSLTTGAIGATGGNIITVSMPAVAYRELSPGDRSKVRTMEVGFGAAYSSGDDEISIAYT